MTTTARDYSCDVCGSDDAAEIDIAPLYTNGQPLHVCKGCGNVYVRRRRNFDEIADDWSNELFGGHYNARIPAIIARLVYVAEFLDERLKLKGKSVCDIGAGEGQFLDMIRQPKYGAKVFGVEPSESNCKLLDKMGIANFVGPLEDYAASRGEADRANFDVVTIMWTLEACAQPRAMLEASWEVLKPGGHVLIATGSRILVPFKKPLWKYLNPVPADTHPGRHSANALTGILATTGFAVDNINSYIDSDVLVVTAKKMPKGSNIEWKRDDWRQVIDFFRRWHEETAKFYPKPQ